MRGHNRSLTNNGIDVGYWIERIFRTKNWYYRQYKDLSNETEKLRAKNIRHQRKIIFTFPDIEAVKKGAQEDKKYVTNDTDKRI